MSDIEIRNRYQERLEIIQKLIDMPLNETRNINGDYSTLSVWIMRVPGGWIYKFYARSDLEAAIFVAIPRTEAM